MQPILNGDAQFIVVVSLLLFILGYCEFINRLRERKLKGEIRPNSIGKAEKQLLLLKIATSILFTSFVVCLARIFVDLSGLSSNCWLVSLDLTVLAIFSGAVLLSLLIFIYAYWMEEKNNRES
jgi:uncharacterized membrane protein YidH (DUF202 family)